MQIVLPKECANLPKKTKNKLLDVLYQFSKIKWFTGSRTFGDTEKRAEELVRNYLTQLLGNKKQVSGFQIQWIEGDWALADGLERKRNLEFFQLWNAAGMEAYKIAEKNGRQPAYKAIWEKVGTIVPVPNNPNRDNELDIYDGVQILANYAARIVIEDLTKAPNLNEPLVMLYQMGLWPRGVITITPRTPFESILKSLDINETLINLYLDNLLEVPKQTVSNIFILFAPVKSWNIQEMNVKKEDKLNLYAKYDWIPDQSFYKVLNKKIELTENEFKRILKNQEDFLNTGGIGTSSANFQGCRLHGYCFPNLDLSRVNFYEADLDGSFFDRCKFINANFERASMQGVEIRSSDMTFANLNYVNMRNSSIKGVIFRGNDFIGTSFKQCGFRSNTFINCDLSKVTGLEELDYDDKSHIDVDTILNSKGRIPIEFLRYCKIPDEIIDSVRNMVAKAEGHTVFISYKHESAEFKEWVKSLANRLLKNGILAFLDQWEVKPGDSFSHYMEKSIKNSKYAFFICSKQSVSFANKRSGGIGYEAELLASLGIKKQIKTIPILRGTKQVPTFLIGKYYLDFNSNDQDIKDEPFNELVHSILGHSNRPLIENPVDPDQPAR
jgi:uncharacterized protein YjbI with pentapeptide repeats